MQVSSPSFSARGRSAALYAAAMEGGTSFMGHACTHRPQRMQVVAVSAAASSPAKARMALFCLSTGSSASIRESPIIGPPMISRSAGCLRARR